MRQIVEVESGERDRRSFSLPEGGDKFTRGLLEVVV
jgi:hypothetical protein